tara:strand:- start:219 stop:722 length:504 start_codon:yes stop_codon:yes gene_type:complete
MLKRTQRTGWWAAGVKDAENVAEHSFRCAIIGFILAKLEGEDAEKIAFECLIHDTAETRIGDMNKVAASYIDSSKGEKKAFYEQMKFLPKDLAENFIKAYESKAVIAKDADLLECALTAKEYLEQGYDTQNWIDNVRKNLKTNSAKKLLIDIEKTKSTSWWEGLKKV